MTDNTQLKARGVTGTEVEEMVAKTMFSSRAIQIAEWNRLLGDKGLLIEHTPSVESMVGILKDEPEEDDDRDQIDGVTVTECEWEADPLMVDFSDFVAQSVIAEMVLELERKHNALVDEVRSNDRGVAGAFDRAFAQTTVLEAKVARMKIMDKTED